MRHWGIVMSDNVLAQEVKNLAQEVRDLSEALTLYAGQWERVAVYLQKKTSNYPASSSGLPYEWPRWSQLRPKVHQVSGD